MDPINKRIICIISEECAGNRSEFARKLSITPSYAAQLYSGSRIPSDRTIKDICRVFCINETWLRTGVGEMKAKETHQEKLASFFSEVLATAPDERSAFIAALSDLPSEFWPLIVEQARSITASLKAKEKED